MKKLISIIIIIAFVLDITKMNEINQNIKSGGVTFNTLRPPALVNVFANKPKPSKKQATIKKRIRKRKARHTIVGVIHIIGYSKKPVEERIKNKDVIIFEGIRLHKSSIANFSYNVVYFIPTLIDRIKSFVTGKISNQGLHQKSLEKQGKEPINLDVSYKRIPPIFAVCVLILARVILGVACAFIVTVSFGVFFNYVIAALLPVALFIVAGMPIAYFFVIYLSVIIDLDFRNLVYATKLSYLPELFDKQDLTTATVVGKFHKNGIERYLKDKDARDACWLEYTNSFLLRHSANFFLDIEESMEIQRKQQGKNGEMESIFIGSIAELPGPREFIARLKKAPAKSPRFLCPMKPVLGSCVSKAGLLAMQGSA